MSKAIATSGLSKWYPDFTLGPLDLDLDRGRVLGFVGQNGSGKTTTMRCLTGLVNPNAGDVHCLGQDTLTGDGHWKEELGFVGDEPVFYEKWTGARNLEFLSGFYPNWSSSHAADLARR